MPGRSTPGIGLDAVRWMHRRGVALYVGDRGDAYPSFHPGGPSPLHGVALGRLAIPLVDAARLDELAELCVEVGRHSFMLAVGPPRIHGLTGVAVNPLALF